MEENNVDLIQLDGRRIDKFKNGLNPPRWLIEVLFVLMVLAAICCWTSIMRWMQAHASFCYALMQTVSMTSFYILVMTGMKSLKRPFTILWIIVIMLNLMGLFVMGLSVVPDFIDIGLALSLPIAYLPLGLGIFLVYRGRLQTMGLLMVIRILGVTLLPVVYYLFIPQFPLAILDITVILLEIIYAWSLRRLFA